MGTINIIIERCRTSPDSSFKDRKQNLEQRGLH
jgi:hypothetical protein